MCINTLIQTACFVVMFLLIAKWKGFRNGNSERILSSIILSSQMEEFQKLKIQSASSVEKPQEVKVFPRLPSAAGCQDGSRKRQIGF